MTLPSIEALNELSHDAFAQALRQLFEAAAPLAEALYAEGPFASYDELIERGETLAKGLPLAQQIEIVDAHPRIGERADRLSEQSLREQGAVEAPAVYAALAELNQVYEDRFGFRFLVYVSGRSKSAIIEVLRQRLENSREVELQTALHDTFLIARDRLRPV